MKEVLLFIFLFNHSFFLLAQQQKLVGDCTVTYAVSSESENSTATNFKNFTKTLYVKSFMSRVDISSSDYSQSIIYNNKTSDAVILKEIGNNKYISKVDAQKWKAQNAQYQGMTLTLLNETKNILGYECKKAVATLKDGNKFSLYYSTAIITSATENPYQFKNVPGLVLEYEAQGTKNNKIIFTATKIDFSPVPASKFEIPENGYRILN
ncbi:MAG: GLPGLI family protein [Chitinophagaceae bacterium]